MTIEEKTIFKDLMHAISKDKQSLLRVHQIVMNSGNSAFVEAYQEFLLEKKEDKKLLSLKKEN